MLDLGTREDYHAKIGHWIFWEEDCPLCDRKNNKARIIWEGKHWYVIHNKYPYSGNEKHLMAVPYKHVKYSRELNGEEFSELEEVQKFMKDFYRDEQYFSATRESMGNRSIEHVHMHFVPWKLQWKFLRCMLENQGFPIKAEVEIKK